MAHTARRRQPPADGSWATSGGGRSKRSGGGGGGRAAEPSGVADREADVLPGPRSLIWSCACGYGGSWASRVRCRDCGKAAPATIVDGARRAAKEVKEKGLQAARGSAEATIAKLRQELAAAKAASAAPPAAPAGGGPSGAGGAAPAEASTLDEEIKGLEDETRILQASTRAEGLVK